jgi:hypothetical protein
MEVGSVRTKTLDLGQAFVIPVAWLLVSSCALFCGKPNGRRADALAAAKR